MGTMNKTMIKKIFWTLSFSLFSLIQLTQTAAAMASRPVDPNAPPPPAWAQWFPMIVMVGVFYFLLIRPQMRQRRERQKMVDSLKKGDRVSTNGGFIVTIVNLGPTVVDVKLNDETKAKILRSAIVEVLPEQTTEAPVALASK